MKIKACLVSELAPGSMLKVEILGHAVLVANVEGSFYAMDGICSHGLADLARGRLDGFVVECPRHLARYDIRTGKVLSGPVGVEGIARDLRSYPVQVERGCVNVEV